MPNFLEISDHGKMGVVHYDLRGPVVPSQFVPLVLLGGMTQTVASWGGQLRFLAEHRQVLVYEARGQGKTQLNLKDVSLQQHVDDFVQIINGLQLSTPVDLCGFSLGGRLALAIAACQPQLIRRLVVSGVGAGRGVLGRIILQGWRSALRTGNLEALAWMSLRDTLGLAYLSKHEHVLQAMVQAVQERNSYEAIVALFNQIMSEEQDSPWHPCSLAQSIRCPTLLLSGECDPLTPPDEVAALARSFRAQQVTTHVFAKVGHTVAIEAALPWRQQVCNFLSKPLTHCTSTEKARGHGK